MIAETKNCQNCKQAFTIEPEDFEFYEKMKVPPPTWCSRCRAQRRAVFRNERNFFRQKCGLCAKDAISVYSPGAQFPVYCQECYWSDKWDPLAFGIEYDQSKSFLDQFRELSRHAPRPALINKGSINSHYTHLCANNKDCYMLIESSNNENVLHGYWMQRSRDCVDNAYGTNVELCYETLACFDSYRLRYALTCFNCSDSWFLKNCVDCQDCFACVNIKHKKYCFFNKQLSKEEYEKAIREYRLETYKGIERALTDAIAFYKKYPHRYAEIINSPGSTGNYMTNSKNCTSCYYAYLAEDSKYSAHILEDIKDVYDVDTAGLHAELLYEDLNTALSVSRITFSNRCWTGSEIAYSEHLDDCTSCFGCIGLRQKSYCILNKQYSKEEYSKRVLEIMSSMKEYGEFFPQEFSPFAYNDTIAQEYFPLERGDAAKRGYQWRDAVDRDVRPTINARDLPKTAVETDESILKEILGCEHDGTCNDNCTKGFRIAPEELAFYKKMSLPLPRRCPNCRHVRRVQQLNAFKLWHRKCTCAGSKSENSLYTNAVEHFHKGEHCPNEFETSYAPDRPEIVYCEQCYQAEVA